MSKYLDEQDDVQIYEPVLAQKQVRLELNFAESTTWKNKVDEQEYDACKLTLDIRDDSVKTEHEGAKPRLVIEDQFNLQQYPYRDKKTGDIKKLGRSKLYQLEEAFGFEPIFKVNGEVVEPYITKTGAKRAPKVENVKRCLNPDFMEAYFTEEGVPKMDNWENKIIYADIGVEHSDQYGDKNTIKRYVKEPAI